MSITTEIQRINGGKQDIRTLASKKNVNIPSTALIDSYASVLGAQWPDCTFNVNYDGDKIRGKTMKWNQVLGLTHPLTQTLSGVSIVNNGNGTWEFNGTATSSGTQNTGLTKNQQNHKYLMVIEQPNDFITYSSQNFGQTKSSIVITNTSANSSWYYIISFDGGVTFDHYKIALRIVDLTDMFGSGKEPITASEATASFAVRYALDHNVYDLGSLAYSFYKGTKLGEYDYIDTTNNKLVLGGAEVDISQMSLTRFLFGSNYLFYGTNNDQETNTTNVISADYQTAADITDIPDMSVTGNGGTGNNLWFRDDSCTTVEQFKTKNAGKKVYFKLATPVEIAL